jgi:hypothetical protein
VGNHTTIPDSSEAQSVRLLSEGSLVRIQLGELSPDGIMVALKKGYPVEGNFSNFLSKIFLQKKGVGSNPALGLIRSIRSSARMPPCHGGEEGSIPS